MVLSNIRSKLSIASLSLSDLAKTIEVSTSLTNGMYPGVSETNAQHSGSHSETFANNQSTKNKIYYQKKKKKEYWQIERDATMKMLRQKNWVHVHSLKAKYKNDPDPQKTAACAQSKAKYNERH